MEDIFKQPIKALNLDQVLNFVMRYFSLSFLYCVVFTFTFSSVVTFIFDNVWPGRLN